MKMQTVPCRTESCAAPMVWAVVEKSGKGVPIDVEPNAEGAVYVVGETDDGRPLVAYGTKEHPPPEGVTRYTSHFQTCPDAGAWSKKPSKKKAAQR